jgi:UDP-N-acetylmuramoyl-tripeptide--D-alanyl-D-alanine ligase
MQRIQLNQLVDESDTISVSNRKLFHSLSVTSVSTDSRSLKEGDFFIAIPGDRFDGHSYVGDAIEKGAVGVVFESEKRRVVEPFVKTNPAVLFVEVPDTRRLFGAVGRNYLSRFDVKKIAVTGSCGKTTTRGLIAAVLSQRYTVVSSRQSYNNDIGVPKTILEIDDSTEVLVQELGTNRPGEIAYLSSIVGQDHALITNVGPAHIGFFGSEMNIASEKKAAILALPSTGVAFLNAEDPYFEFLKNGIRACIKSFGSEKGGLVAEKPIRLNLDRSEFGLSGVTMTVALAGMHGVINAVGAALVGLHFGCSLSEVKQGIESYQGESGRGKVYTVRGVTFLDESYNANPMSVRAALDHVAHIEVPGRKVFVFADMLELGAQEKLYHGEIAKDVLGSRFDALFTYGGLSAITASRCSELGLAAVFQYQKIEELSEKLSGWVRTGDLVLIKGSRAMRLERVLKMLLC